MAQTTIVRMQAPGQRVKTTLREPVLLLTRPRSSREILQWDLAGGFATIHEAQRMVERRAKDDCDREHCILDLSEFSA